MSGSVHLQTFNEEDVSDSKRGKCGAFYCIAPYFLLIVPCLMGLLISLFTKDSIIRKTFPSAYFGEQQVHKVLWSFTCASFPLGGAIGTFSAIYLGRKIGRKLSNIIYLLSGISAMGFYFLSFFTQIYTLFILSRFIMGIASGGTMNIGIIYHYELIPSNKHYIASLLIQPLINLGILISGILSFEFIIASNWFLTGIPIPVLLVLLLLIVILLPESPRYLIEHLNDTNKARQALTKLRGNSATLVDEEISLIQTRIQQGSKKSVSLKELFSIKSLKGPLIVTSLISVFQQVSGINIVIFYISNFIKSAGFKDIDLGNVIMFTFCFVGSLFFAGITPRVGAKRIMVFGFTTMSLSFFLAYILAFAVEMPLLTVIFLAMFLFWFQCGPGPKPWSVFNETFSPEYQSVAQGFLTFNNWLANFLITAFFPFVMDAINFHSVLVFAILNAVFALTLQLLMVETKGKSYDEIINDYSQKFGTS